VNEVKGTTQGNKTHKKVGVGKHDWTKKYTRQKQRGLEGPNLKCSIGQKKTKLPNTRKTSKNPKMQELEKLRNAARRKKLKNEARGP